MEREEIQFSLIIACTHFCRSCKSTNLICDGEPHIIFAWALNASGLHLPPDVGVQIGPSVGINSIVVQIHYGYPESESTVYRVYVYVHVYCGTHLGELGILIKRGILISLVYSPDPTLYQGEFKRSVCYYSSSTLA